MTRPGSGATGKGHAGSAKGSEYGSGITPIPSIGSGISSGIGSGGRPIPGFGHYKQSNGHDDG